MIKRVKRKKLRVKLIRRRVVALNSRKKQKTMKRLMKKCSCKHLRNIIETLIMVEVREEMNQMKKMKMVTLMDKGLVVNHNEIIFIS